MQRWETALIVLLVIGLIALYAFTGAGTSVNCLYRHKPLKNRAPKTVMKKGSKPAHKGTSQGSCASFENRMNSKKDPRRGLFRVSSQLLRIIW